MCKFLCVDFFFLGRELVALKGVGNPETVKNHWCFYFVFLEIQFLCHKIHPFKVYNSVVLLYSRSHVPMIVSFSTLLFTTHQQSLPFPSATTHPCSRQPLGCFLSVDLHILDIFYKWNHITYDHFYAWLLSRSIMFLRVICAKVWVSIPFRGWVIFHCADILHVVCLFIGFHFWAVMIKSCCCGHLCGFVWMHIPKSGRARPTAHFNFLRNYRTLPKQLHHFAPTSNVWGS